MRCNSIGNVIGNLRKTKGLTQKQLAIELNISDKAVSKWERGLSLPDISLFPKISRILDCDMEYLLTVKESKKKEWIGILYLQDFHVPIDTIIYDKPMVYYILTPFLLADVKMILIFINDTYREHTELCVKKLSLDVDIRVYKCGDNLQQSVLIYRSLIKDFSVMLWYGAHFIYGANLTRSFQWAMENTSSIRQITLMGNNDKVKLKLSKDNLVIDKIKQKTGYVPLNIFFFNTSFFS